MVAIKNAAGRVLFECRATSLRNVVLAGTNLNGANLAGANLYGADLSGASLYGANLARAYLAVANLTETNLDEAYITGANFEGANLEGATFGRGVTAVHGVKQILGLTWPVLIFDKHIKIGCEMHLTAEWAEFNNRRIAAMGGRLGLEFWRTHKTTILALAAARNTGTGF